MKSENNIAVKKEFSEEKPKTCFVIMPISDVEGYDIGHFKRVYEHIVKPACHKAGFKPLRADDINTTNHIIIDILKHIIEADMAICDLSGRNPNVLYELGIRQAFNLPVTLIKDDRTSRIFDIQTLRDVPYDSSLRIDKIEEAIPEISSAVKNTYSDKTENINSIVQLLGIESAKITKTEISGDTNLILDAVKGVSKRLYNLEDKLHSSTQVNANEDVYFAVEFSITSEDDTEAVEADISKIVKQQLPNNSEYILRQSRRALRFEVTFGSPISSLNMRGFEEFLYADYADRINLFKPFSKKSDLNLPQYASRT